MGDQTELEIDQMTIAQLLRSISNSYGKVFDEIVFDQKELPISLKILVLVNGRNYRNLPNRLDTDLKDGDEVHFFPPAAGG